ncbi:glycosyltransferase [Alcaligenes aquatilis]|uniref:Glycosyltransferase n=1 Tax=Alcaligenes aquatilis TaxID=323284 RepID=A0ABY4NJE9_9BURK|nr:MULTISPECIES: glycosyltransferase [Alcaligenes]UQN37046.1 glycosyltransferase [Alcaligenes aquatilis]HBQ89618.1 glycosyltransferase family 1 protein [Alcaligenes faecalis]
MKVLITDIHHGNGGGHVTYILGLLRGLAHQCDFTLAVPATGRLYREALQVPGVRVLPGLYTARIGTALSEIWSLRRFLQREAFDIVHCNGSTDHRHVMIACKTLPNPPVIIWTKHNTNRLHSVGNRLRARFGTDLCIAVSDYVARQLANSDYRRCNVERIYHGLDLEHYCPVSPQEKWAARQTLFGSTLPDNCLVLGSVGGTDLEKGWLLLVEAVARLEPELKQRVRVVVAGDPPAAAVCEKVQALGCAEQVLFPGLVKDVRSVLAACDVGFVLSYKESASYACYESLALGLPVLISNAGGLPESIEHLYEGWVVPCGDVGAIEAHVRDMLCQKYCLQTVGRRARKRAEKRFDAQRFSVDTYQAYLKARALSASAY